MNPRSEWFKWNTESESIRRIPTSDSWGLKDWSGFIRIQSLGLTRIETDWFLTELHQTRLKTFFRLTRMSSDWRGNRFRNNSVWFGMNFNPKLLPELYVCFVKLMKNCFVYKHPKLQCWKLRENVACSLVIYIMWYVFFRVGQSQKIVTRSRLLSNFFARITSMYLHF